MSKPRLIRISSRALGHKSTVRVWIYDTAEELRAAAQRFHPGESFTDAAGVCQYRERYRIHADGTETMLEAPTVVRLSRTQLGSDVTTHEMNHAAVGLYGRSLPEGTLAADVLHTGNEELAYLASDLTYRLVNTLYEHGYYA